MNKQREAFEAWAIQSGFDSEPQHQRTEHGYRFEELNGAWLGWQAAIAAAAKVCDSLAEQQEEDKKLFKDERHGVYAKKFRKAAACIRHLARGE